MLPKWSLIPKAKDVISSLLRIFSFWSHIVSLVLHILFKTFFTHSSILNTNLLWYFHYFLTFLSLLVFDTISCYLWRSQNDDHSFCVFSGASFISNIHAFMVSNSHFYRNKVNQDFVSRPYWIYVLYVISGPIIMVNFE